MMGSDGVTRRDFVKTLGAVSAAAAVDDLTEGGWEDPGWELTSMGDMSYSLEFLSRVDWRNLKMLPNGVDVLQGSNELDWEYNEEQFWEKVSVFVQGVLDGGTMNEFQKYSASEGFVSTPDDGIGAAFTPEGRMCSLFFPYTGFTTHIPYYTHGDGPLQGAKEMEGGFAGVDLGEGRQWLWEEPFRHDMRYRQGTGIMEFDHLGDDVDVEEASYVMPDEETLVRDFTVRNRSDEPVDGEFLYYTRANVNDAQQNFVVWESSRNRIEADDELHWEDLEGQYELAIAGDRPADETEVVVPAIELADQVADDPLAEALVPGDELYEEIVGEVVEDVSVVLDADEFEGRYLGGTLSFDMELEPGEEAEFSVFVQGGEEAAVPDDLRAMSTEDRQEEVEKYWDDWLEGIGRDGMSEQAQRRYRRAVGTLGMMHDPETGSIPAAPNLQPMYYPSWIRDSSFISMAMARAGKEEIAEAFLGEYLPAVQEGDGGFKQCYDATGDFAGIVEIENDQPAIFVESVAATYRAGGSDEFLERVWPAVEDALEYMEGSLVDNGLPAATPDFAEMPTDIRQSIFTAVHTYDAFRQGDYLARELGKKKDYERLAEQVGDATYEEFVSGEGDFDTVLGAFGAHEARTSIFGTAVWPTGWAEDYGVSDTMVDAYWEDFDLEGGHWVPGDMMLAAAFYHEGEEERGDYVVDRLADEQTASGNLAEMATEEGKHYFGAPLGWAQAGYVLAMQEKYG
ncbi:MAG: hypothetical protein SV186_00725 [Candidatus Nanohaloarchaea archaeon]|nr:hypothetical protein [Candidatus Nanohaloarchaea archaeon]